MGEDQLMSRQQWLCTTAASLCIISCICSLFTIAIIAFNRYVYVCWNDMYDTVFTRRRTVVAVISTWVAGIAFDLPNHLGWSSHRFDTKTQKCLWDRITAYHYTIFFVVIGMLLPFVVTFICYWRIFAYIQLAKQRVLRIHYQARPDDIHFSPRDARIAKRVIATLSRPSVPLAVCLSVHNVDVCTVGVEVGPVKG